MVQHASARPTSATADSKHAHTQTLPCVSDEWNASSKAKQCNAPNAAPTHVSGSKTKPFSPPPKRHSSWSGAMSATMAPAASSRALITWHEPQEPEESTEPAPLLDPSSTQVQEP